MLAIHGKSKTAANERIAHNKPSIGKIIIIRHGDRFIPSRAFQALSNHDLEGFMSAWRDDGVLTYPGELWASGTFNGKPAVSEWCRKFFEQYPKIFFDVQQIAAKEIFALTGTNVFLVHWNIYLTNKTGREGQNSGVSVISLKAGKVIQVKDFVFDLGENFRLNWGA